MNDMYSFIQTAFWLKIGFRYLIKKSLNKQKYDGWSHAYQNDFIVQNHGSNFTFTGNIWHYNAQIHSRRDEIMLHMLIC